MTARYLAGGRWLPDGTPTQRVARAEALLSVLATELERQGAPTVRDFRADGGQRIPDSAIADALNITARVVGTARTRGLSADQAAAWVAAWNERQPERVLLLGDHLGPLSPEAREAVATLTEQVEQAHDWFVGSVLMSSAGWVEASITDREPWDYAAWRASLDLEGLRAGLLEVEQQLEEDP